MAVVQPTEIMICSSHCLTVQPMERKSALHKPSQAVSVSAGIFTVSLDFGANAFNGASRYLEIGARPSGAGLFTLLTPASANCLNTYAVRSL